MEDRQRRNRRQFTPEFKRDAVELVRSSGRPIAWRHPGQLPMSPRTPVTLSNENGPSRFSIWRHLHPSHSGRLKAPPGRPAAIPESTVPLHLPPRTDPASTS
jgi:transposase-like protein